MCGEGRRKGLWSTSAAIHNIKAFIFFCVVVDLTFYFTFSCCDGPSDLCTSYFFILVYCVPVLVRKSGWVEKASFLISSSWQAVCLWVDAHCWLSVGVGGTCDRDRWWHAGVCQMKTAVARARRNAFLISKACFHLLWRWGMREWLPGGLLFFLFFYVLHANALTAYRGCLCRFWNQLQSSHWFDGNKPSISHGKKFLDRWEHVAFW